MRYCEACKITINAPREHCPLCQRHLSTGAPSKEQEPFPLILTYYQKFAMFFRILIFASITITAVSVVVNLLLPKSGLWSLIVAAGLAYMWLTVITAVKKWQNIAKNILYQVVFTSVIVMILDRLLGWYKWSVNYVIPALCLFSMLAIFIIEKVKSHRVQEYGVYLIINGVFCLVPLLLLIFRVVSVPWPSMITVALSVILLSFVALFTGLNIRSELKRRLHL